MSEAASKIVQEIRRQHARAHSAEARIERERIVSDVYQEAQRQKALAAKGSRSRERDVPPKPYGFGLQQEFVGYNQPPKTRKSGSSLTKATLKRRERVKELLAFQDQNVDTLPTYQEIKHLDIDDQPFYFHGPRCPEGHAIGRNQGTIRDAYEHKCLECEVNRWEAIGGKVAAAWAKRRGASKSGAPVIVFGPIDYKPLADTFGPSDDEYDNHFDDYDFEDDDDFPFHASAE
jgi:hypothetical protein